MLPRQSTNTLPKRMCRIFNNRRQSLYARQRLQRDIVLRLRLLGDTGAVILQFGLQGDVVCRLLSAMTGCLFLGKANGYLHVFEDLPRRPLCVRLVGRYHRTRRLSVLVQIERNEPFDQLVIMDDSPLSLFPRSISHSSSKVCLRVRTDERMQRGQ